MRIRYFQSLFFFVCTSLFCQNPKVSDTLHESTGLKVVVNRQVSVLDSAWKFNAEDNKEFLKADFDDSKWVSVHTSLGIDDIDHSGFKCFGIFRTQLILDSIEAKRPHVLYVDQVGASEIYINGELIKRFGTVSCNKEIEQRMFVESEGVFLPFARDGKYVIAIKYSNTESLESYNAGGAIEAGFRVHLLKSDEFSKGAVNELVDRSMYGLSFFVFFATVGLLHFLLFLFYTVRKSNLYFAMFCFILSYFFLFFYLYGTLVTNSDYLSLLRLIAFVVSPLFFASLLSVLYSFFYEKFPRVFHITLIYCLVTICICFYHSISGFIMSFFLIVFSVIDASRIIIIALKNKKRGAYLITIGFGFFILFFAIGIIKMFVSEGINILGDSFSERLLLFLFSFGIVGMPLSMSIFLAWDFSQTSRTLSQKLIEVEELSARTIEQEKEKQKLLAEQNVVLETQVQERTKEISEQKKVIEEKNKDITDSINYAQRIQRSILPTREEINEIFKDCFVLFKPRDIVSGDFYQFKRNGSMRYAILADCTGHGVPGALMSMIGSNLLQQIISERGIREPDIILRELHKEVRSTLRQGTGIQSHDGMDASIVLNDGKKLFIASANRPVYIVKNGELTELKPDKRSIGGSSVGDDVTFNLNEMEIESGMMIYLFSDGYADQFGGEKGKKFKVKNLSDLLVSICEKPLELQKEILDTTFDNWKKHLEQVDDVSLIGLRF